MPSLSRKALRKAAPLEALPYELTRKYGEPTLHASVADVRTALGKSADELGERIERIGSAADKANLELLREQIAGVVDGAKFPIAFDIVVDDYSGTRFQAIVCDRRQG